MTNTSYKLTNNDIDLYDRFPQPVSLTIIFFKIYQNAAIDFRNIAIKHYQSDTYEHT